MMNSMIKENGVTFKELEKKIYSREQRAKQPCLHGYLATAARVKYPAALQRCKFDTPLLAAGSLILEKKAGCLTRRGSGYIIFLLQT